MVKDLQKQVADQLEVMEKMQGLGFSRQDEEGAQAVPDREEVEVTAQKLTLSTCITISELQTILIF